MLFMPKSFYEGQATKVCLHNNKSEYQFDIIGELCYNMISEFQSNVTSEQLNNNHGKTLGKTG